MTSGEIILKLLARLSFGLLLSAVAFLHACGGSDGSAVGVQPAANTTGSLQGKVVVSSTSAPLANAKVSAGAVSTRTDASGNFTLTDVPESARAVIRVEADSYVDGLVIAQVVAGKTLSTSARLMPAAAAINFTANAAVTLKSPTSVAQVTLPANSMVDAATGAAVTGPATARITDINPALDPETMPGDYTVSDTVSIESFGAIKVTLQDASGARLNLKTGSSAVIRIPLATRSASPPTSIPLYYFNEDTGRWVEEGSATLAGTAPNQYYEGTVTHFSAWNADISFSGSSGIVVRGCVQDGNGARVTNALVSATGVDYSGVSNTYTKADGTFVVPIRKNSLADIVASLGINESATVGVGPSGIDINLPACLTLTGPKAPTIVRHPEVTSNLNEGARFALTVGVTGSKPLTFQWKRNGVDVANSNSSYFGGGAAKASDAGQYTVTVSNGLGSITSNIGTVTVKVPDPVVSSISPSTATVGQSTVFTVVGTALPLTASLSIADATCQAGSNSSTGFSQLCTLSGTAGNRTVSVRASNGGTVIDASRLVNVIAAPVVTTRLMNDTGLPSSNCYEAGNNSRVSCTSAGAIALNNRQDGMIGRDVTTPDPSDGWLGFSFSEVANPISGTNYARTDCVKDNVTGLMWEGNLATGVRAGPFGNNPILVNAASYVAAVNTAGLCGFKDWRMPSVDELLSIAYISEDVASVAAFNAWFNIGSSSGSYASGNASVVPANQTAAFDYWSVALNGGQVLIGSGTGPGGGGKLVRGAALSNQFTVSADGQEVTDTTKGLIWRRCTEGMSWNGTTCTGTALTLNHENALARARDEAQASSIAWRLPNIKELHSLVDRSRANPAIESLAFPNTLSQDYWSSTPWPSPLLSPFQSVYGVNFASGITSNSDSRSSLRAVRLVRSSP
jgi:hypothetical protein